MKIPNVSNLVKKTDYDRKFNETEKKITDHDHDKYITTPGFNKLTTEKFAVRLAKVNLETKSDISFFRKRRYFDDKLKNLNKKVTSNKTKNLLVENELQNLQLFDSSLFIDQRNLNNHGAQLYLIFQPIYKTITTSSGLPDTISKWESKGLSYEKSKPPYTENKSLSPKLVCYNYKIKLKFKGSCLKQKYQAGFTQKNSILLLFLN